MSQLHAAGLSGGFAFGVIKQILNEIASRVPLRVPGLGDAPPGDVLEPIGDEQRSGANGVEKFLDRFDGRRDVDPQAARATRPLLATTSVGVPAGGGSVRLTLELSAPGADWGAATGNAGMAAIYVDGRYHSTTVVYAERTTPYEINLGLLAAGSHAIEVRGATDVAPTAVRVGSTRTRIVTGEQALLDAFSPIIELRDVDRGTLHSSTRSDAPLMVLPAITRHPDGSHTIEYRMIFSNEDGGTAAPDLLAKYGRTADAEPVYRVTVDAEGRIRSSSYQSPLHRWVAFDGAYEGGRPVLRVSTANNLVSARTDGARPAERWSEAPVAAVAGWQSEFETMRDNPWTWTVMAKELLREGKVAVEGALRGAKQVGDPRRYVYLGPLDDAAMAAIQLAGGLEVVLDDGRRVLAKVARHFANSEFRRSALELPTGASADAIRGVSLLGVSALVLDQAFGVRVLAHAA